MTSCSRPSQQQVNEEWDGMAGSWDDLAGGFAAGLHSILWSKLGIADPSTLSVLDFGCGTGLLTDRIRTQVSKVVALDAAPKMVELLQDKIDTREWKNVTVLSGIIAQTVRDDDKNDSNPSEFQQTVDSLAGTMDVIVASSVLNFIPDHDLEATCQALGRLLKPNSGRLLHVDWSAGTGQPVNGMTQEKASHMYAMAGLSADRMEIVPLKMGKDQESDVFLGVAIKNS